MVQIGKELHLHRGPVVEPSNRPSEPSHEQSADTAPRKLTNTSLDNYTTAILLL